VNHYQAADASDPTARIPWVPLQVPPSGLPNPTKQLNQSMTTNTMSKTTFNPTVGMSSEPQAWRPPEWRKHNPAKEAEVIALGNARQVSLWVRLRAHYWANSTAALSRDDVDAHCRRMARVDAQDRPTEADLQDLLTPDFGFARADDGAGWHIPDLQAAWHEATAKSRAAREHGSKGGKTAASRRRALEADLPLHLGPVAPPSPHPSECEAQERPAVVAADSGQDTGDF
jgi:hypothetical protein